ncbi:hypothetical protein ACVIIW_007266 [Bradyrhizobium sp. USDA 4449]
MVVVVDSYGPFEPVADAICACPSSAAMASPLTRSLFLYGLAHGLYVGAIVILCRKFRPNLVDRLIAIHKASVIYGVPTQLEMMIESAIRDGDQHSLQHQRHRHRVTGSFGRSPELTRQIRNNRTEEDPTGEAASIA